MNQSKRPFDETSSEILDNAPCSIILPAGCGKTELVASLAAATQERGSRTLVLTHTNAGVSTIRKRLDVFGARSSTTVRTIDSWSRAKVHAYPKMSGLASHEEEDNGWSTVHIAARRQLNHEVLQGVIEASYALIVVDEYQDCSVTQHELVQALAKISPVVILGDPMQSIYGFGDNELVDWQDVVEAFPQFQYPVEAWRWKRSNPELGVFLMKARNLSLIHI